VRSLLRIAYWLYRLQTYITRPVTLGVRVLLIQDERIVLVRHTYQDGWFFPGGALNRGETPRAAARREAREEAGAEILDEPQLLGLYSSTYAGKSDHVAVYVSRNFRIGTPTDRWEIAQCKLFPLDALPADLIPGSEQRIREALSGDGPFSRKW
jgi:8-oxo-dGTP pyrophosphatase MutT (NUDIX family)